ncbi:hypothetical protein, partial [uncultured Pseudomonas sp.]|uniref:hypothetical protein n=1 Tax=uncultured Pseudomonas sp. TaxID=114707 RepID=UPI0027D99311
MKNPATAGFFASAGRIFRSVRQASAGGRGIVGVPANAPRTAAMPRQPSPAELEARLRLHALPELG